MFDDAVALVLAGGLSRRFGANKALVHLRDDEPLIATLCRELLRQFSSVAIAAKTPELYAPLVPEEICLLADEARETNPLVGIHAGLAWAPRERLFVVACDMPLGAADDVVETLHGALGDTDAAAYTWRGYPEPLCAFYRKGACLPVLPELVAGGRGPRHLLSAVRTRLVSYEAAFPQDEAGLPFLDLDTPGDLDRFRRDFRRSEPPAQRSRRV